MDKVTEITQLAEQISTKGDRFYNKGVKCSGTETRKLLQDMVKLCRDLRKDVLEKQKAMPKKESGNRVPPTRTKKQPVQAEGGAVVVEPAQAAPVAETKEVKAAKPKVTKQAHPEKAAATPAPAEPKKTVTHKPKVAKSTPAPVAH